MKSADIPVYFIPTTGELAPVGDLTLGVIRSAEKDMADPTMGVWRYNPYTGVKRDMRYVNDDPYGYKIIPQDKPGAPLYPKIDNDLVELTPETLSVLRGETESALQVQEGGDHYKSMKIQPIEFIHANNIPFAEGNVIKYVSRWRNKNGIKDLEKARHFIDLLIELETKANRSTP